LLRTEHLSRHVSGKAIVDDVSLQVNPGEIVAISGPSGAGKTSLLRLINRLDEPTSGTVYLEGNDYRNISPRNLRRQIGMVMQAPLLFPGTVANNIRFGPQQRGETLSDTQINTLLEHVGLAGYTSENVQHLSGGEAQRVALVRTLANNPCVLLLDEPTSALDDAAEQAVETLLMNVVQQQNIACLLITHKPAQAIRLAQRALLLNQGKMECMAPVAEVLHA
jgi:putative ABC transport system ATP-binding protein